MRTPRTVLIVSVLVLAFASAWAARSARADEPPAEPTAVEPAAPAAPAAEPAAVDPAEYGAKIRTLVTSVREKVREKLEDKISDQQEQQVGRVTTLLGWFSMLGVLLLFAPLWLRKKHPGKTWPLFKYSAVAAITFIMAVNLFTVALTLLRTFQGALGTMTNPKIAVVEGAFDALDKNADDFAQLGPSLIEPTLTQLQGGESEDPLPVLLLDNLQKFGPTFSVMKSIAGMFRAVSWIFGYVPILLSLLAAALFVKSFWPVFTEIIDLPSRAVAGEPGAARRIVGETFRKIGRELLATLCLIGTLFLVTILSGIILFQLVAPAMEAFISYIALAFVYLQVDPDASATLTLLSLAGVMIYLVLNIAAVTISSGAYLARTQTIFRQRFHDKVPLKAHKRFWGRGTLALVWAQLLPVLFNLIAVWLIDWKFDRLFRADKPNIIGAMMGAAALLAIGLAIVFWLARGVNALGFLFAYKRPSAPPADPAIDLRAAA
jgi:hypothetical protein